MNLPQRHGRTVTIAHAAGLMLLAGSPPVVAQSGLGAVVCVGSELGTPRTPSPDRRFGWEGVEVVYHVDVAVAYRAGVPLDNRERVERTLRSELAEHAKTTCAWSNPGDGHLVIASYAETVRLDPASGPDVSGFRRFAVGYGASAEAAETNATTANPRFVTYNDGSGYEVFVREAWRAGEGGAEPGTPSRSPGEVFRDCAVCPQMVVVPAGTFTMGSPPFEEGRSEHEGPQRDVRIEAPFAVGVYEVTFAEWDACVRAGGCGYTPADRHWGRGRRPVIYVNWEDAQAYVSWLSRQTGKRYRLLSEAEWEYAARAGTITPRPWSGKVSDTCRYANGLDRAPWLSVEGQRLEGFSFESPDLEFRNLEGRVGIRVANLAVGDDSRAPCRDGYARTAPVGSLAPNAFGLYDMLGNVLEWTQDCWNDGYRGAPADGSAWESGDCGRRVLRGGSWFINPWFLRSANRFANPPVNRDIYSGFRVARPPE